MDNLLLDKKSETEKIIDFIKKTVKKSGFRQVIVGLSGGVDSSTAGALATRALGAENVIGVTMPYGEEQKESVDEVKILTKFLKLPRENFILYDIKPLVEPIFRLIKKAKKLRKGNIMVRMRMILLYDLSKKYKGLVLGTENKTEYLLGYFTRFGDEASDIEPIRHLYKSQVKQLAKYLGLPNKILEKTPTAGMWPGQTDEGELDFSYLDADMILSLYVDKKRSIEKIKAQGFKEGIVKKVVDRMKANDFKHRSPYIYIK